MKEKKRKTIGFWWKPKLGAFVSEAVDLKNLPADTPVRFYLRKNQYFDKNSNRPNYQMSIGTANAKGPVKDLTAAEGTENEKEDTGTAGEKAYSLKEVQDAVSRAFSEHDTKDAINLWESIKDHLNE